MVYGFLDEVGDIIFIKFKIYCDFGLIGIEVKLNVFIMLGKERKRL